MKSKTFLTAPLIALGFISSAQGALLFYEDFTGFTAGGASLDGQGGWSSPGDSMKVRSGSFVDGGSGNWDGTIGNSTTSGGNFIAADTGVNSFGNIALASTVTNSFVSGTTTWLSYVEYNGRGGADGRQNLAIGAAPLTTNGGLEMAGQGIGVATTNNNTPQAAYWTPSAGDDENAAASTIGSGRPIFVIAKILWDDVGNAGNDVITVKRFAFDIPAGLSEADWNSEAGVSTNNADLVQSTFGTLSFANLYAHLDEIRIASDFDSAVTGTVVIPEPSSALLMGLGALALLRRRR